MADDIKKVKIQVRRGVENELTDLSIGEPALSSDSKKVFIGTGNGNKDQLAKQGQVDTIQTDVNTAKGNISTLQTDNTKNKQDISQLKTDTTGTRTDLNSVSNTVGTLGTDVETAKNDISTLKGTKAEVETARNGAASLDERLKGMEKADNRQSWKVTAATQTRFTLTNGSYTVGSNSFAVYLEGILQPTDAYVQVDSKNFDMVDPVPQDLTVTAVWREGKAPVQFGHNTTHYKGGQDPLDLTKLDGYAAVATAIQNLGDPSVFQADGTNLSDKVNNEFSQRAYNINRWSNLKVAVSGGFDWSPVFQAAIKFIMERGGGTLLLPDGNYTCYADIYTHPSNLNSAYVNSPLTIKGVTPVVASLYNNVKTSARLIKKQAGSFLGVNYNETTPAVLTGTGVYRNLYLKNLDFYGGGTYDTKYTNVMTSTLNMIGVEKHNSAVTMEDCHFWGMAWGVYDPETVNTVDNYCDQSTYRRLGFSSMGTGWIQAYRSDSSIFEGIYGYDMAISCQYGIRAKKGEAFSMKGVLCAGKAMHLAQNFKLISAEYCNSITLEDVYMERIEGVGINLDNNKNVTIKDSGVRHYGKTYIKGTNNRNVKVTGWYAHVEEGKVLDRDPSTGDTGDYTKYATITLPVEFDFDNTNTNVQYENTFFRNGVHSSGSFSETTARIVPRLNTTSKAVYQVGDRYTFDVIYDGSKFVASVGGVQIAFGTLFASSNPTFNTSTGELTFPTDGAFTNLSSANVSGRRSASGVVNFASKINSIPLTVRLYNFAGGALVTAPADVAFSVTLTT